MDELLVFLIVQGLINCILVNLFVIAGLVGIGLGELIWKRIDKPSSD